MNSDRVKQLLERMFKTIDDEGASEGEIASAMAAAQNLMAAHQLTREDVVASEESVDTTNVEYAKASVDSLYQRITLWESLLARFVTNFVGSCKWYYEAGCLARSKGRRSSTPYVTRITIYGPKADVEFAVEVWNEVVLFITTAARLRYGNALSRGRGGSYAEGFARTLWERQDEQQELLERQSEETPSGGQKNALMVVNTQLALVDGAEEWLKEDQGIELSPGAAITSQSHHGRDAYRQGREDGKSYKPGARKERKSQKALPSA